eukprot:1572431-Karenia_brevis.AAC.1
MLLHMVMGGISLSEVNGCVAMRSMKLTAVYQGPQYDVPTINRRHECTQSRPQDFFTIDEHRQDLWDWIESYKGEPRAGDAKVRVVKDTWIRETGRDIPPA